jgi:hypothetical protein
MCVCTCCIFHLNDPQIISIGFVIKCFIIYCTRPLLVPRCKWHLVAYILIYYFSIIFQGPHVEVFSFVNCKTCFWILLYLSRPTNHNNKQPSFKTLNPKCDPKKNTLRVIKWFFNMFTFICKAKEKVVGL